MPSQPHPVGRAYNAEDPRLRSFSVRVDQLAESAVSGTVQCGFESLRGHHKTRHNLNMTTPDEDREMADAAEKVLMHIGNSASLKTAILAAFRLFHSMGYRRGYSDAMDDAVKGKDQRVKAHLN